ncbi:MAG: hypothetical protein ABGY75_03495, partial [Gemmataceae bacterium]
CPNCGERSIVAASDVGRVVGCPKCPTRYTAGLNEADNTPEAFVELMRPRIRRIGDSLFVAGVIGIVCPIVPLTIMGSAALVRFEGATVGPGRLLLSFVALLCAIFLSSVITYGGTQMKRLRNYPLCVLASVLAMLPFANLCFPLGWFTGPFALYFLRKPEVRRAFALNRGEE